jgi:rhodanese-related sulfurtransferase
MPQNITKGIKDLVAEAGVGIETISIDDALARHADDDVQFIDIRDVREVAKTGRIPGARHVPRGMLEFWIAPDSPYHKDLFTEDKTFIFYCAASWRSVLATRVATDMGLKVSTSLDGGLNAWIEAGGPIEAPKE